MALSVESDEVSREGFIFVTVYRIINSRPIVTIGYFNTKRCICAMRPRHIHSTQFERVITQWLSLIVAAFKNIVHINVAS